MTNTNQAEITETNHSQFKTIYLREYQAPHYWVDTVDLVFDLHDNYTEVKATLVCQRNTTIATDKAPFILQGEELELISIKLEGKTVSSDEYQLTSDTLTILSVPAQFTVEIINRIYPDKNTQLSGLYRSKALFCTQCEAEGFRRITFFPDRPDIMAKFTTTIYADKKQYPVLLSNGNCVAKGSKENRHWVKWEDPSKKPCYLFALVAGNLVALEDHFVTTSGRLVTLKIYVEWENQDKCAHAMSALKKSMKWDEETYGREYDLDIYMIVAVNDFNMGAMENKGLNIFNSKYILARPETATDGDFQNIDSVVGHEYFHNWSGNRVTCRDWFQLSLKEGFTVFRDQHFSADITQSPISLIENAAGLRSHQFSEDAGPLAHPVRPESYVEINNFYTSTVYEKGAEVIRMLKTLLGWDTFRRGTDLYFERHDGQAVTTEDFVAAMESVSGQELTQFKLWYSQAGTPEIEAQEQYDQAKQEYHLTLSQKCRPTPGQPIKLPMHIPIAVGLLDSKGSDLLKHNEILSLKEKQQTFTFTSISEKPMLSLLRSFSAPVKIISPLTNEELSFLLAHDSDDFNRWDAGQKLSERVILKLVKDVQEKKPLKIDSHWLQAHLAVLENTQLNRALKVEILSLPSTAYLIEMMKPADTDAVYAVKKFLLLEMAKAGKATFLKLYHENKLPNRYQYTTEDTEKRALKNLGLAYLLQMKEPEHIKLCMDQWLTASNMTDSFAALSILCDIDCSERKEALNSFYDRWQHDPLVVDKWLRVQAMADLPNTLETVQSLMNHPAFDISNPNKVYSLIGAFGGGNTVHFHHKEGKAYQFLADVILKIDPLNPQVASRMVGPLTFWKLFDTDRQAKMCAQLKRIQSTPNLSRDVLEIVNKCLH
jgi:aminopeptidase N